jgi:hypothetical protein
MQCSFGLNNLGVCLNLRSWSWCLRCCSVVVSSKGMHKVDQNYTLTHTHIHTYTHTHKSPTKCPMFIYSSCGRCVFPPLLWSFPPTATFRSFPVPAYWAVLLLLPATMFIYSSCEWIKKMCYTWNTTWPFVKTWMRQEDIILSKTNAVQTDKYCIILLYV